MQDGARRLVAVDEAAAACGAFPGQGAADALALLPRLAIADADPAADCAALADLARWCLRFSPAVALDPPEGVFIDIAGCAHLWGGEEAMAAALAARLAANAIPARIAIADSFGAAWAFTRHAPEPIAILADAAAQARLAALPVDGLRLPAAITAQLRRLGLRRISDVARLPRAALRKRFPPELLTRLAQAQGAEDEPLDFLQPPSSWRVRRVFAEPILRPEDIQAAVGDLAGALCVRLDREGLGARRFTAAFHIVDGATQARAVEAALPMREARRLAALFAPKLETLDPGFGVEVVVLEAEDPLPLHAAQGDLVSLAQDVRARDLAPLVDRLVNRLGADRVWRAAPVESHVPERSVAHAAALAPQVGAWAAGPPRPLRLFRHPEPVEAMAPVPDDPPLLFRWRGISHRVVRAEGPERIAAEWWRDPWEMQSPDRVRDYYRVEDETGARFWLFRAGLYDGAAQTRWFLHGLFA